MQEMETKENQIIHGVIWKQLLIFFFPYPARYVFPADLQHGRHRSCRTFCGNRGFGSSWRFNQPDH